MKTLVRRIKEEGRDEKGAIMVIAALVLTIMLGFAAFAIDISSWRVTQTTYQNAADAAALMAATKRYKTGVPQEEATKFAFQAASLNDLTLNPDEMTVTYDESNKKVNVVIRRPTKNSFRALNGHFGVFEALHGAFQTVISIFPSIGESIMSAFDVSSNAVTMAESSTQIVNTIASQPGVREMLASVMNLVYVLNILLFVCNIIPIPALDGGHIMFAIPELFGKPLNAKVVNTATAFCYYAILSFSVLYFAKDFLLQVWRMV